MVIYSSNILKWLICLFKDSFTIYFCINIHLVLLFPGCHWKIDPSLLWVERLEDVWDVRAAMWEGPERPALPSTGAMMTALEPQMDTCSKKEFRNNHEKTTGQILFQPQRHWKEPDTLLTKPEVAGIPQWFLHFNTEIMEVGKAWEKVNLKERGKERPRIPTGSSRHCHQFPTCCTWALAVNCWGVG